MPSDDMKYNLERIEDKRAASMRPVDYCHRPVKFDSKLARKALIEEGYGEAIDEFDRLLREEG